VLIDSRLPPQAIDLEFVEWLGRSRPDFALIFTKADKQSGARSQANIDLFKTAMNAWRSALPETFLCSAKTKAGRTEILGAIEAALAR
jgi:GTP-binding protein